MKWDLIIFDCDGVLVDSEPVSDRLFSQMLAQEGFSIPQKDFIRLFLGFSMESCVKTIEEYTGKKVPDDFLKRYYEKLFEEFRRSLQPIRGVKEALDNIPYPICVASSGEHEKMRQTLGITGLLARFNGKIFSAQEVKRGKPFPDLFLHAAEKCNARTERCAVVEDSIPGIKAGIAAGMKTFAYIGTHDKTYFDEIQNCPVTVFHAMHELSALLEG
jgi:HAD superfamily hydrolase (TIGR01509 family)